MSNIEHRAFGDDDERAANGRSPEQAVVPAHGLLSWPARVVAGVFGLLLFILALELLKDGARGYGRELISLLQIQSAVNSLGFGWLLAYVFLSGSPVAAIAISFFAGGMLDATQTFTMITGSRLGASLIVLLVGFVYRLRGHRHADSLAIGVLALLTTAAIYLPALIPGFWLLQASRLLPIQIHTSAPLDSVIDWLYTPLLTWIDSLALPGPLLLVCGVACLVLAFHILDRALPDLTARDGRLGRLQAWMDRPLTMFLVGAAITSVTLSVSVSLSILVPLAVRGAVRREQTIPYIMGANITTFIDTLLAALIVGGVAAFIIVLVEMVSVALLSLLILLCCYRRFARALLALQAQITGRNRNLALFLAVLLVVPLLLMIVR